MAATLVVAAAVGSFFLVYHFRTVIFLLLAAFFRLGTTRAPGALTGLQLESAMLQA